MYNGPKEMARKLGETTMAVKLTWIARKGQLDLSPSWIVESVLIHVLPNYKGPNGDKEPHTATLLVVKATSEQLQTIIKDYGKENIPLGILGITAIPIYPNQPIWKWVPPKGYEQIPTYEYDAFRVEAID
jgi:hypothetical protein